MKMEDKKNWLEWLVLIISSLLVLGILVFLVHEMIYTEQTPPNITVDFGKTELKEGYFAVPITAKNIGSETAEDLQIEVINGFGNTEEKALLEFPYLPGNSSVNGWVTFTKNPENQPLVIHILGYATP